MRSFIAALLFSIIFLPLLASSAQTLNSDGCVVASDYADVPSALTASQATPARCLRIPAGEYVASLTSGNWAAMTADHLDVRGAGEGLTTIRLTDGITLTNNLYLFRLLGVDQHLSDLTIRIGVGYHGTYEIGGVSVYDSASQATIDHIEVIGGYSGNGANGNSIATYRPWSTASGDQYTRILNCYIHDSPATGIVVNSNHNTIGNTRIERVGVTTLQHGFYIQGGYNLFDHNTVIQASGYNYHAWQKVQRLDGSGNVFRNNISVDPGFQHMIVSGLVSDGVNPAIPVGKPLTRSVIITGNIFRNTGSLQRVGLLTDVPALIESNIFEDVVQRQLLADQLFMRIRSLRSLPRQQMAQRSVLVRRPL